MYGAPRKGLFYVYPGTLSVVTVLPMNRMCDNTCMCFLLFFKIICVSNMLQPGKVTCVVNVIPCGYRSLKFLLSGYAVT